MKVKASVISMRVLPVFKATEQLERINIHFKGCVLINNENKCLLVVVYEYSIILFICESCNGSRTTVTESLTITSSFSLPKSCLNLLLCNSPLETKRARTETKVLLIAVK